VAGEPGLGKSTFALQVLGELAREGARVLYLTTEQSLGDVKSMVGRLLGPDTSGTENFLIDTVGDLSALPSFLTRRILSPNGEYFGCRVVAIDSLQGGRPVCSGRGEVRGAHGVPGGR